MAVYVDQEQNAFGRMIMCHMLADSLPELHAMADKIGMRRAWFQPGNGRSAPHYDLSKSIRKKAVAAGAIQVDRWGIVNVMRRLRGDPPLVRPSDQEPRTKHQELPA